MQKRVAKDPRNPSPAEMEHLHWSMFREAEEVAGSQAWMADQPQGNGSN